MIQIRRATDSDTPALEHLFLAARLQAFHWCHPSTFQRSDFSVQTEGEVIHVAESQPGKPLGFISVWQLDSFVHHLYVDPAHQREGIGTLLLASLREWLPLPHTLKCLERNLAAISFYRKHGWKEQDRGSDALGDYLLMEFDGID